MLPDRRSGGTFFPGRRFRAVCEFRKRHQFPACALLKLCNFVRRADVHFLSRVRLVADHVRGVRAALRGTDAFPVDPAADQHFCSRLRKSGSLVDGLERGILAPVIVVGRGRIRTVYVEGLCVLAVLFPEFIFISIRKDRGQIPIAGRHGHFLTTSVFSAPAVRRKVPTGPPAVSSMQ